MLRTAEGCSPAIAAAAAAAAGVAAVTARVRPIRARRVRPLLHSLAHSDARLDHGCLACSWRQALGLRLCIRDGWQPGSD